MGNDWKPIETAPRDRWALVDVPSLALGRPRYPYTWALPASHGWIDADGTLLKPKHWLDIAAPPPPSGPDGKSEE